jgi:hypothetical protein
LSNGTPPVTTIQTPTPSTTKYDGSNVDTKSDAASSKAPPSLSYSVTTPSSSSILQSKYSRPPSPPSVYASFGYGGPIKNPRPLLLDAGMQLFGGWKKYGGSSRSKDNKTDIETHHPLLVESSSPSSHTHTSAISSARPSTASSTRSGCSIESNGQTTENLSSVDDDKPGSIVSSADRVQYQEYRDSGDNSPLANSSPADTTTGEAQYITAAHEPVSAPETPSTPQTAIISEGELRRRKLERLYRTLGESVPPELVFREAELKRNMQGRGRSWDDNDILKAPRVRWNTPAEQKDISMSTSAPSSRSSDRLSDHQPATEPSPTAEHTPSITLDEIPLAALTEPRPIPVGSASRSDDYENAKPTNEEGHWLARQPKVPAFKSAFAHPLTSAGQIPTPVNSADEVETSPVTHHSRGKSEQTLLDTIPRSKLMTRSSSLTMRPKPSHDLFPSSPHSTAPFAPYSESASFLLPSVPTGAESSGVRRKERKEGWSGEWNLDDMQDVIRKLRDLK